MEKYLGRIPTEVYLELRQLGLNDRGYVTRIRYGHVIEFVNEYENQVVQFFCDENWNKITFCRSYYREWDEDLLLYRMYGRKEVRLKEEGN